MGHVFSKAKTAEVQQYTSVLGLNSLSTLEEGKKAYMRHFYGNQGNREKLVEINDSFDLFKRRVDVELYYMVYSEIYGEVSEVNGKDSSKVGKGSSKGDIKVSSKVNSKDSTKDNTKTNNKDNTKDNTKTSTKDNTRNIKIIRNSKDIKIQYDGGTVDFDFTRTTEDFFNKLAGAFEIKAPVRFTEPEFEKFYRFWGRFSAADRALEAQVRRIVGIVKRNDPRIERVGGSVESVKTRVEKSYEKKQKTWKYFCEGCKRGFNNESTLRDHKNSRQHRMNYPEEEAMSDVKSEVGSQNVSVEPEPAREQPESTEVEVAGDSTAEDKTPVVWANEHVIFRTCGICKRSFNARTELIIHLREAHGGL